MTIRYIHVHARACLNVLFVGQCVAISEGVHQAGAVARLVFDAVILRKTTVRVADIVFGGQAELVADSRRCQQSRPKMVAQVLAAAPELLVK